MSRRTGLSCLKFSLLGLFLLILQAGFGQSKKVTSVGSFPDLESDVENRRKELGGDVMVYVANRDTIIFQKAFGDINPRTQVPVGAASQWFTTALVLQLVDEGKLSLDDKVTQYLPVYGSYFKNYITIRHCLSHMTGIEAEPFKTASLTAKRKWMSLEEEVTDFAKKEIKANAGEEFRYNTMGLNIAAHIVEIVTKKKFEQLTRQRLFTPLGMRNTTFASEDGSAPNPSAGAKSTPGDMIRFLQMILNNGSLGGKQILSEKAVAEMRKVQVEHSRIKAVPKTYESFAPALGTWAVEGAEEVGQPATVLAAPGLMGTWPMVDFSRGYAFVLVPKTFAGEQNANVYLGLKEDVDQQLKVGVKR